MASATTTSAEFAVILTEDERAQLLNFLEQALRDKRVEVHRTEAPDYREHVRHQEAVMESLIGKLRRG